MICVRIGQRDLLGYAGGILFTNIQFISQVLYKDFVLFGSGGFGFNLRFKPLAGGGGGFGDLKPWFQNSF